MSGCDVYDLDRDALTFTGGMPVIAHPPCRAWGSLKHFAKPRPGEKDLAIWAVDQVRRCGGVLEHPAGSQLFPTVGLPSPRGMQRDQWGGWTMAIWQSWWGHRADKATKLYIVGCDPGDLPGFPLQLGLSTHVVSPSSSIRVGHPMYRPQLRKAEREHTPRALAEWLVDVAGICGMRKAVAA
ncbi:hypothetical protein X12_001825 [Xanthomonas arboricola]|uniref:Uncharacterized protein n=1 Tax=Xanthomonas campestris pv. juglandis TaxID=195709 RepID=A0A7U7DDK2_XANCJ|nr:hypothetical protein AE924_06880 [Xanthomonas arboricola]PPU15883.1 hypothetical protein XacyCFBP2565_08625 [Xanthomonas arboricola pv. corylina]CAD1792746.1 hypothetical protein XSP_002351 [Xanthomonas arboricola pv. juglandis]CAD2256905.1 hypothetical protein X12_001825 [Xanthomonas arboricola]CAD7349131.1 hypothetical protein X12_002057 [Xanthomonas arboricola]